MNDDRNDISVHEVRLSNLEDEVLMRWDIAAGLRSSRKVKGRCDTELAEKAGYVTDIRSNLLWRKSTNV